MHVCTSPLRRCADDIQPLIEQGIPQPANRLKRVSFWFSKVQRKSTSARLNIMLIVGGGLQPVARLPLELQVDGCETIDRIRYGLAAIAALVLALVVRKGRHHGVALVQRLGKADAKSRVVIDAGNARLRQAGSERARVGGVSG